MSVDVLLFGAHPDDIEWGIGGTAILLQQAGISFATVDFTRGEMGSRGTPAERAGEAQRAAELLGGVSRINLELPDGALTDTPEARKKVARAIREFRPSLMLAPYWKDRHPDHAAAGRIVRNASVYSISQKLDAAPAPHKPAAVLYYLLHHLTEPALVVDVSTVYERKQALLRVHGSQFGKTAAEFGVLAHGTGDYLAGLESRDRYFGSLIGTTHGEALMIDRPVALRDVGRLLRSQAEGGAT